MNRVSDTKPFCNEPLFRFHHPDDDPSRLNRRQGWFSASQLYGDSTILKRLGISDVTLAEYHGELPRCVGMRSILREIWITLNKRFANTPLLYGENGVGKSTVPYLLAKKIVDGRVPERFQHHRLLNLDLSFFAAGADIRGQIGDRWKAFFAFLNQNPHVIVVIDEFHLLFARDFIGSEFIHSWKVNLCQNRCKFILITDMAHVRQITEDPAILGRVTLIEIPVPSRREVCRLFRYAVGVELSRHYHLSLPRDQDLIALGYQLSEEVMPYDRCQPARMIKLFDTAMARQSLKNDTRIPSVCHEVLQADILRETARSFSREDRQTLTREKRVKRISKLAEELRTIIIGQDEIVEAIACDLLLRYRHQPQFPAAYLLYGDSGVGKTRLAYEIGFRISGQNSVIRIDCSQMVDGWASTTILGSYPGLVLSDRSSLLSKVRINPYTTFIFDELEKAHPDIILQFLQILQPPYIIRDNRGVELNFSRALFFFTSNIGHSSRDRRRFGFRWAGEGELDSSYALELSRYFPEEFLGRLGKNIYRFRPLEGDDLIKILDKELAALGQRYGCVLEATSAVKSALIDQTACSRFGVRAIQAELSRRVEPKLLQVQLKATSQRGKARVKMIISRKKIKLMVQ